MDICIFGDSIGKGVVLEPDSGRYKSLKLDLMEPLGSNRQVRVKNYAMFGCTVTKGLSLIERHGETLSGYDHVLLEFGGNDCNFLWHEIANAPDRAHQPKTPLDFFVSTYKHAIEKIQKAGVKPVLLTLPPLDARRFFAWVSKGVNAENILKWLGDKSMIYRWQELYSLAVLKLGKTLGVPVIDIRSEFLCRQDLDTLIGEDGMHPTQKGYELLVRTACAQLA